MPPTPVPPDIDAFLRLPNPAVIASLRSDGSPHTAATWYDWDGRRAYVNMDATRVRLRFLRRDGRCALTVLAHDDWYRHVSLLGVVERWEADTDLSGIDGLSMRYRNRPYSNRTGTRVGAWIAVHAWHGWDSDAGGAMTSRQ
jgi:PPOX class probable F420-dependent enzyme